jgi:hypothetical protein
MRLIGGLAGRGLAATFHVLGPEAGDIRLGYVGTRPQMAYFAERSAIQSSDEPGVLGDREFRFGVKEADSAVYEASWQQKLYSAGP